MLFGILQDIESKVDDVNESMKKAEVSITNELKTVNTNMMDMKGILSSISNLSAVTVYNTAKIARYSEISAKGTEALLFLKAIYG